MAFDRTSGVLIKSVQGRCCAQALAVLRIQRPRWRRTLYRGLRAAVAALCHPRECLAVNLGLIGAAEHDVRQFVSDDVLRSDTHIRVSQFGATDQC